MSKRPRYNWYGNLSHVGLIHTEQRITSKTSPNNSVDICYVRVGKWDMRIQIRTYAMVELAIIILNYQTYELTIQCIKSILETQSGIIYRIIIVDDCSPNDSIEKLICWIDTQNSKNEIILVKTDRNGGYSAALNKGIREAQKMEAEYISIINNDLIFTNNYFSILRKAAVENQEIAIWGGSVQGKDGSWQVAYKLKKTSTAYLLSKKPLSYIFPMGKYAQTITNDYQGIIRFYGMISGCCFMFHFRLLEKIGMWDENIYLNHEEDAIAAKLYALGLQCAVVPRATLIHLGSQTIGSITPFQYYHRYISEIYVLRKYYNASSLQLFLLKIIDNIALWKNISDKEIRKGYRKAFNEYYKTVINDL